MDAVIAHAPAKINLSLMVEPLRAGEEKHRLSSDFCTISLADTLVFTFEQGQGSFALDLHIEDAITPASPEAPAPLRIDPAHNTLTKALAAFTQHFGEGILPAGTLKVQLIKSIPLEAGLGGGSSDAAALLRMLCWLAQVEPTSPQGLEAASAVGADVPFFLHAPKGGLCARMGGYGNELREVLGKPELALVLVKPAAGVSTREAYQLFDTMPASTPTPVATLAATAGESYHNNLEPVAIALLPHIASIKSALLALPGVEHAQLCGSGSTIFGICQSQAHAHKAAQHFYAQGLWAVAAHT